MGFMVIFFGMLAFSFVIDLVLSMFISNYFVLQMISSLVLAFAYSLIFIGRDRRYFYRSPRFYSSFGYTATFFILFDMIMNWINLV